MELHMIRKNVGTRIPMIIDVCSLSPLLFDAGFGFGFGAMKLAPISVLTLAGLESTPFGWLWKSVSKHFDELQYTKY
jgi:hypothetical protein